MYCVRLSVAACKCLVAAAAGRAGKRRTGGRAGGRSGAQILGKRTYPCSRVHSALVVYDICLVVAASFNGGNDTKHARGALPAQIVSMSCQPPP